MFAMQAVETNNEANQNVFTNVINQIKKKQIMRFPRN